MTVGLTLAAMAAGISPSLAQPVTSLDPASLVPGFRQAQTPDDKAEANIIPAHISTKLNMSSLRVLGKDSAGTYAAVMDITGQQICVIAQMNSKIGSIDSACLPKTEFAQSPISLGVQENVGGATVSLSSTVIYLFPADVELASLNTATLNNGGGAHTIVQHGTDALPQRAELGRSDSSVTFSFSKPHLEDR